MPNVKRRREAGQPRQPAGPGSAGPGPAGPGGLRSPETLEFILS